jgi:hypothetical protein
LTGTLEAEQLDRLKFFYADPLTPRGDLDPHRFLGQRVASTFAKDNHTTMYEGTVVSFDFLSLNYGISWDDGDYFVDNSVVTIKMIENWFVKTVQVSARARIKAGAPFTLMVFHHDSLERKAARSGAFHFLVTKHRAGLSFEFRDNPHGSDQVYILRNLASILPHYCSCMAHAQSRSAEPMTSLTKEDGKTFGNWPSRPGSEPKSKLAPPKILVRARPSPNRKKTSTHKNVCAQATCQKLPKRCSLSLLSLLTPSTSYASSTPRVNWNTTRNSGPHFNRRLIFGKVKRAGISCSTPSASAIRGHISQAPRPRCPWSRWQNDRQELVELGLWVKAVEVGIVVGLGLPPRVVVDRGHVVVDGGEGIRATHVLGDVDFVQKRWSHVWVGLARAAM